MTQIETIQAQIEGAAEGALENIDLITNQSWLTPMDRMVLIIGYTNSYAKRLQDLQEQLRKEKQP